jgi:hypothetical protein
VTNFFERKRIEYQKHKNNKSIYITTLRKAKSSIMEDVGSYWNLPYEPTKTVRDLVRIFDKSSLTSFDTESSNLVKLFDELSEPLSEFIKRGSAFNHKWVDFLAENSSKQFNERD